MKEKYLTKIPVTFAIAKGGHAFEALALVRVLAPYIKPSYIITEDNFLSENQIQYPGPIEIITLSLESTTREMTLSYMLFEIKSITRAFFQSIKHLKAFKSYAVVSSGSGTTFATMLAAKLLGKKVIFVKSACRLKTRSMLGDIAYRFLADLFLVQWEEQLKMYPKATYAGRPF